MDLASQLQDDEESEFEASKALLTSLPPQYEQLRADAVSGKPDAQFLLSQVYLQQGDIEAMQRWLRQATEQGFPDALGSLGQCYEKGQGVSRDMAAAMEHYDRAVEAGSSLSMFFKAQLLYKSRRGPENSRLIYGLLARAAEAGVVVGLRAMGYLAMQNEASRHIALACLRRAATRGDPASSFMLGWCLMQGWGDDGGSDEPTRWLQQAASAEYPFADALLSATKGKAPGPQAEPADEKIRLGAAFAIYPESKGADRQDVSTDPPISVFNDVLDVVDCAYLIYLSRPYMKRAHVIDPEGDKSGMVSNVRTSMSTYLPFEIVDIIGRYIELKIILETGEELSNSEPMSILRYAPGEYYRPHVDFFNPTLTVSEQFLQDGGQRTASAVTYLTAPKAGGGTSFPKLGLTVPAKIGATLWFRNCLDNGEVDTRSLHAGDTVAAGEKWVVTKWFREKSTQYLQL